ncbi:hypothetical protein OH77DRAFT_1140699 [Trametes cingulata]|nr:hypothetical protein OH77DRAFT_1140699 [Trametes cingulata]
MRIGQDRCGGAPPTYGGCGRGCAGACLRARLEYRTTPAPDAAQPRAARCECSTPDAGARTNSVSRHVMKGWCYRLSPDECSADTARTLPLPRCPQAPGQARPRKRTCRQARMIPGPIVLLSSSDRAFPHPRIPHFRKSARTTRRRDVVYRRPTPGTRPQTQVAVPVDECCHRRADTVSESSSVSLRGIYQSRTEHWYILHEPVEDSNVKPYRLTRHDPRLMSCQTVSRLQYLRPVRI